MFSNIKHCFINLKHSQYSGLKQFSNNEYTKNILSNMNKFNFCSNNTNNNKTTETSFGFKTVKTEDRQNLVNSVFENVAKK